MTTHMVSNRENGMLLRGLDGSNPLGFLAALGVLRLLSVTNAIEMEWQTSGGTWHPILFGVQSPIAELGKELHLAITKLDLWAWSLDKKLPFLASRFREHAHTAATSASRTTRERADAVASLGVDCYQDDDGIFEDTSFRMVRSGDSSGQGLLAYGKRILDSTVAEELQLALTDDWQYRDDQCGLRWDPAEDRGYALQWRDPSKVGALSNRAGNCLALIAIPLLPTIPGKREAETTGFGLKERKAMSLTWPIWEGGLNLETVKSVLSLSSLQRPQPPRSELCRRGVAAAYRSKRIMTSTYYANFTPAIRIA